MAIVIDEGLQFRRVLGKLCAVVPVVREASVPVPSVAFTLVPHFKVPDELKVQRLLLSDRSNRADGRHDQRRNFLQHLSSYSD
jgi:hypothetical protein